MNEVRTTTLGRVVRLKRGYDLPTPKRRPGTIPILGSFGITGWHDEAKGAGPGVTIGRSGASIGVATFHDGPFWPLNTALYAYDFLGNVPRFVYYLLESIDFAGYNSGSAQPSLNRNFLEQIPVVEFGIVDQLRIADVLGSIDDLITKNRRRAEVLEEMTRAIYREWFVKFRYPGHEEVPLVDSALGPIPEGWRVQPLATIATVNGSSRKPHPNEVFKYLDISAVAERDIGELDSIGGAEAPGRARRVLNPGDTVWATVRPNRRAHALVVEPGSDWIASTGLAVLTPKTVSPAFLFETTSTPTFSDWLVGRATGSAYPAVRAKDFEEAQVVVPDAHVESAFAKEVAPMHELSWKLRTGSSALARLRDLLLPMLVTGQIDVSTLDLGALVSTSSTSEAQDATGGEQGSTGGERGSTGEERGTTAGVGVA